MKDERDIVKACIEGDEQSKSKLYQQYSPYLFGMALRYTSSEEDAKDVLQDAFISIFDNLNQFSGKGTLQGWMTRIVINQAIKLYQKASRRGIFENFDEVAEELEDCSVVQSDKLTHKILLDFIRDLPEGYRMVFNLCEIEGYSYEEVASILNCTNATCRSQLFKAKRTLKKKITIFLEQENKK